MRTFLLLSFLSLFSLCCLFACSWVGETAGTAGAKIEKNVDDMKEGYQKGYSEEIKKQ